MAEETQDIKLAIDFICQAAKRRRWPMLFAFFAVAVGVLIGCMVWPAVYRSEATILVEQPQVPERYVVSTTTTSLLQVLQPMTEEVLSRAHLLQIIQDLNLYPSERKKFGPDEVVDLMRKNIAIEPLIQDTQKKEANAFRISYLADRPGNAQQVVTRLTSRFIAENLKLREDQAKGTTNFLQDQLAAAQETLQKQEQQLSEFKMQHLGELPQEQQGNLQILAGLQMQLQNAVGALGRARQQEVYLQSLLAQYRGLVPKNGVDPTSAGLNKAQLIEKQLADLRAQRISLLAHYTPEHPDVVNIEKQIKDTEALLAVAKLGDPNAHVAAAAGSDPAAVQAAPGDDAATAQLKSQLQGNELEVANLQAQEQRLQAQIAEYQRRLNLTPVVEQQLAQLLRDYSTSQKNFDDLENKKTQSALAEHMEMNQQGQQFRVVDPPSLPTKPYSPDRQKLSYESLVLGIALATVFALLLEFRDSSFHNEKEAGRHLPLPFVLGVPLLLTPTEENRRFRVRVFEWTGGSLLVTSVLAAAFFVYWRG